MDDKTTNGAERLRGVWISQFGDSAASVATCDWLLLQYGQPHRRYHGISHLASLYTDLDSYGPQYRANKALHLAIWFHDCVFSGAFRGDETASIQELWQRAPLLNATTDEIAYAAAMIEKTGKRPEAEADPMTALFLDLDYAVLAAPADEYFRYLLGVHKECKWWLRHRFAKGRRKFIARIARRAQIFLSEPFTAHEEAARENLRCERHAEAGLRRWDRESYQPVLARDGKLMRFRRSDTALPGLVGDTYDLQSVAEINVFKRDLWATDQICMLFTWNNDDATEHTHVLFTEDTLGAKALFDALPGVLPGALPFHEWFMAVAFPAFTPSPLRIYRASPA